MELSSRYYKLYKYVLDLYNLPENRSRLLFHGWHHIKFVHDKAKEFAIELDCDLEIVLVSALLHDFNFIYSDKLEPEAAKENIKNIMIEFDYDTNFTNKVLETIINSHIEYRYTKILSNESKALADADTLFKALPTTPILFSSKFITENSYDLKKLGNKIVSEQKRLMESGQYFYTKSANERYLKWAKHNLQIWEDVLEALEDDTIKSMLKDSKDLGVI